MITNRSFFKFNPLLLALFFGAHAQAAVTDISTYPLSTYTATSSTDVKPNVLFVLDDSGSMSDDYLPDWATDSTDYYYKNTAYNGIAYNPSVRYYPPTMYNSDGTVNASAYPSMVGTSTTTGGNSSATSLSPNWHSVPDNPFLNTNKSDLVNNAYYYTIIPGEYCTLPSMRSCTTATAPTGSNTVPAPIRWCDSSALTTCRSNNDSTFSNLRMATPRTATLTVSGASTGNNVTGITVSGQQIMSGTATASTTSSTFAQNIAAQINLCSNSIPTSSNCTVVGYVASSFGSSITILAPGAITATPVISQGTHTVTATAFAPGAIPGENLRTTITSTVNSYVYPGTAAKAVKRTDCVGTTCTYVEEMTNYANWWAYYSSRMQMMKTAASNAFASLDTAADLANNVSRFRVGYMTINNTNGGDFLNLGEFSTSQKHNWYTILFAATPGHTTPLRGALATAGKLYAGKETSINGVTVTDPLQYSCQQNYTILSTDGFWNETATPTKLDGTAIGNQDSGEPRPLNDGGTAQIQQRTAHLQSATITPLLQKQISQLQATIGYLQQSTKSGGSWSSYLNVNSCTWGNNTKCRYLSYSYPGVATCTVDVDTNTSSGQIWHGPTRTKACNTVVTSAWANAGTCVQTTTPDSSGYTTQCQTIASTGTWVNATSCDTTSGTQACQYASWGSWSNASSCTPLAQDTGPVYTVAQAVGCQSITASGGVSNTLADVAEYYYTTDLRSSVVADGTGTCTGPIISPATTATDLCENNVPVFGRDQATSQHMTTFTLGLGAQGEMVYTPDYWNATSGDFYDIKAGTTATPTSGICSWQSSGACNWPTPSNNYLTNIDDLWHAAIDGRGTYYSATDPATLSSGLAATLNTIINTPKPGTAAAAASSNPNVSSTDNFVFSSSYKSVEWYGELVRQQINATTGVISSVQWSGMALLDCATTSWAQSTAYVPGAIYQYAGTCYQVAVAYTSGTSFGSADTTNSNIIVDAGGTNITPLASRNIYFNGTSGLTQFLWANLTGPQQSYFTEPAITYVNSTTGLSQFCTVGACLTSAQKTSAAGANLVNFLRGDRSNEISFYRQRTHVLGDIVSSEGRYVKQPLFTYGDAGYSGYVSLKAARQGEVYVAANDGMLHAFNADTGQESWAYIPSMVLPNLYSLADKLYNDKHQYFVDGTPEVGDMCPNATTLPTGTCTASQWKTILVGGLNRGGKGYYALDITDPANPAVLWEISSATTGFSDLGYTYGNPKITKLKDGRWVVIFTSGYNNATGNGVLYVVNAATGALIRTISTNATGFSATSPSGLARISAYAPQSQTDNTTYAVYGGDLFGNLWRFDINGDIGATGYDAQLLVTLKDASSNVQPITAKPTVTTISTTANPGGLPVVFIGTGQYLGTSDIGSTSQQSFYAIKDKLNSTTYTTPHSGSSGFVQQTLVSGTCPASAPATLCTSLQAVRTVASNTVDWNTNNGWYMDFLGSGERSTTDSSLGLGTLVFTTIAPQASTASVCGTVATGCSGSYSYALNYLTGGAVDGAYNVAATSLGCVIATRPVLIELPNGTIIELIRTSGGGPILTPDGGGTTTGGGDLGSTSTLDPTIHSNASGATRRTSWRTLQ